MSVAALVIEISIYSLLHFGRLRVVDEQINAFGGIHKNVSSLMADGCKFIYISLSFSLLYFNCHENIFFISN